MKKFVFILSFVFAMFFANTTFAATTDNSSVNEKAQIVLTETNQSVDVSDAVTTEPTFYIIIFDDGTVIIVIID